MRSEWRVVTPGTRCPLFVAAFILFAVHCSLVTDSYALDVKRDVLENGLTLLVVERHNLPIVKISVGVKAGSIVEPEEKAGLANLTASLLTDGTKSRTGRQISDEIDFVGGAVGASSDDDYSTVTLSVLKKDLNLGLDLLSDIVLNPSFPEDELNKKRERIKGGLKSQEDDPGFVASREFRKAVFGTHPYGRLIAGTPETLDSIKRDDLLNFHAANYVPNNAIMAVVGDITTEEVKNLLGRYFPDWRSKDSKTAISVKPAEVNERKIVPIDKELTQANIILGHAGVSRDNPDYYAVSVMNYILGGGGFESRLMQNVREEKGLAYDIHSFFDANRYGGLFEVGVQTKNESANTAIEEILREIKGIRNSFVSDAELSDAKSFLVGSFPLRFETGQRIANFLVAVEYYGLGPDYIDKYSSYINSVTKEDVLRVATKYLDPENFVLVVVADQKKAALKDEFK
ncbi:MAG: insulinase family protein [Nitrospiraceae bacterium]|nr:MAG: insulinase family protein [Nitrospiraceae bacterium]